MLKVLCSSTDKTGSKLSLLKKIMGAEVKFGAFVQTPEGDLEGEEDLLDLDGAGTDHGSWKTSSVEPRRIMSPSSRRARRALRPLTSTPFVDSRSTT